MYCQQCGTQLSQDATFCERCGQHSAAAVAAEASIGKVASSFRDALEIVKRLATDPVGNLAPTFTDLGPKRSLSAGVMLWALFAISASVGVTLGTRQWLGQFSLWMVGPRGFGDFIKIAIAMLMLPMAITATSFGVRKLSAASADVAADVYTAGAAVVPLGMAILLSGVIGAGNLEIAMLLNLFGLIYLVLLLFAGLTRAGGLSERAAAPAVPVVLLLSLWLCKVVITALL